MTQKIQLNGQRFGRWTVIAEARNPNGGQARWHCRCDCGNEASVVSQSLRNGISVSCGCYKSEQTRDRFTKHGATANRGVSAEYGTYHRMLRRCEATTGKDARDYHDRGIRVCPRWLNGEDGKSGFECFLSDMGPRPKGLTIDRIDNSKGYEPGNCRWASVLDQANNKRNNRLVTYRGEEMTFAEAWRRSPKIVGLSLAYDRLKKRPDAAIEAILETPPLIPQGKRRLGSRHF